MRREASQPNGHEKTATITVFLVEELGDARVRCDQLKKYIDEATGLIEKSPQKDHFFEVAGHLMHGIPEVLMKMEKALEAAAMAASRIDYEEIKERLKPEKVEELEKALEDIRIRRPHRSDGNAPSEGQPTKSATVAAETTKKEWEAALKADEELLARMHKDVEKLKRGEKVENLTLEGAQKAISGLTAVIHNKKQLLTKLARENPSTMNARIAAQELTEIADQVEQTGTVPMAKLVNLIARLERGKREASVSGASPQKVAGYFRALADGLAKTAEDQANKPSRFALAQSLRRVVADQMPMTSAQVAAQIYQQSNSREDVQKGFKESNPDLTEAQLKEIADQWERNKDVVKDKHQ